MNMHILYFKLHIKEKKVKLYVGAHIDFIVLNEVQVKDRYKQLTKERCHF